MDTDADALVALAHNIGVLLVKLFVTPNSLEKMRRMDDVASLAVTVGVEARILLFLMERTLCLTEGRARQRNAWSLKRRSTHPVILHAPFSRAHARPARPPAISPAPQKTMYGSIKRGYNTKCVSLPRFGPSMLDI